MSPHVAIIVLSIAIAAFSFVVLIPVELGLRQSNSTLFPWLGIAVRRIHAETSFDIVRSNAIANSQLYPVEIGFDQVIVSTQVTRCTISRESTGDRCRIAFRLPLGLVTFVLSVCLGVPLSGIAQCFSDPAIVSGVLVCCCFMTFLAYFFLSLFWKTAIDDSQKIIAAINPSPSTLDG